jgi:ankyrin repeat protein
MILERGAQANSVMGGWSALQLAISFGSPAVCAVLLQHGADVNYSANTTGWQKGKDTLVSCLNTTPLHASVMNDSPSELVGMLLKVSDYYRYRAYGLYSFLTASRSSIRKAGARVDAVDGKGSTSLTVAASQGRLDKVALLLSSGADPNIESLQWGFALIISITNGHTAVSMLLIENGADVNGTSSAIGGDGMVRQTPLHACGMAGLLSSSKRPRDGELETSMTLSTRDTDIAMAQIASALLEHGADVNAMMEYKALEVSVAPILMNL